MKIIKRYKSGHTIRQSKTGLFFVYEGRISKSFGFYFIDEAMDFVKYLKS